MLTLPLCFELCFPAVKPGQTPETMKPIWKQLASAEKSTLSRQCQALSSMSVQRLASCYTRGCVHPCPSRNDLQPPDHNFNTCPDSSRCNPNMRQQACTPNSNQIRQRVRDSSHLSREHCAYPQLPQMLPLPLHGD